MRAKTWLAGFFAIVIVLFGIMGKAVYDIDPYFHYRKPDTTTYFYKLNNERSQNDGICKHFDYDALITGTSMTENFMTSEMDEIFGVHSVKVSYAGASFKEINDHLKTALAYNSDLKTIVRCLDTNMFFSKADQMSEDWKKYPFYLYDENPINDVKYLLNKDAIFGRVYSMIRAVNEDDFEPGITSFDVYSNWQIGSAFGVQAVYPDGIAENPPGDPIHLSETEKSIIRENIDKNVTSLTQEYSDVTFYYFFPPYSIAWWKQLIDSGEIYRVLEAEQYIIELILECDNIRLYSFNNITDITTNLNHYTDPIHYGEWINSLILWWMYEGEGILTKDNYEEYLMQELDFYSSYDYGSLSQQEDYEDDEEARALAALYLP